VESLPQRRRACLAVPGSSPRKLQKAAGLAVDEVVIDLEDAVLPDLKDEARAATVAALGDWRGSGAVAVRINALGTPWCPDDVAALAAIDGQPLSIVAPKVESAADVEALDRLLADAEATADRPAPLHVQALIETAAGLQRVDEIARASQRIASLIIGYADLGASLGGTRSRETWLPVQHAVLVAARSAGVQAIDGPYLGVAVDPGFEAAIARARELGFDGKWAIHPAQVESLIVAFTPTAAEVEQARRVVDALDRAERDGAAGAVALDGQMLDEALRLQAQRLLARAGATPS
jgi:citrate lyase subunit beta/citryl-CoA lyase